MFILFLWYLAHQFLPETSYVVLFVRFVLVVWFVLVGVLIGKRSTVTASHRTIWRHDYLFFDGFTKLSPSFIMGFDVSRIRAIFWGIPFFKVSYLTLWVCLIFPLFLQLNWHAYLFVQIQMKSIFHSTGIFEEESLKLRKSSTLTTSTTVVHKIRLNTSETSISVV